MRDKKRKALIIIVSMCMLFSMFPITGMAAGEAEPESQGKTAEEVTPAKKNDTDEKSDGSYAPLAAGLSITSSELKWSEASNKYEINGTDNLHLEMTPVSKTKNQVKAKITFSVSGEGRIEADQAEIRLPRYLFFDRQGNPIGGIDVSVPKAPDKNTRTSFNYTIEKDPTDPTNPKKEMIVFKNHTAITEGSVSLEADLIWDYIPLDVENGYTRDDIKATFEIKDQPQETKAESEALSLKVNTTIGKVTSNKTSIEKKEKWNTAWGPAPVDAADYFFVKWQLKATVSDSATSPVRLYFEEFPDTSYQGEVVAWSNTYAPNASDGAPNHFSRVTAEEMKNTCVLDSSQDTKKIYNYPYSGRYVARDVIIKYPRSLVVSKESPSISNKFTVTMKSPENEKVESTQTATSTATYKYQKVNLDDPVGNEFTMYKRAWKNYTSPNSKSYNIPGGVNMIRAGKDVTGSFSLYVQNKDSEKTSDYQTVLRDRFMYIADTRLKDGDYEYTHFYPGEFNIFEVKNNPDVGKYVGIKDGFGPLDGYELTVFANGKKYGTVYTNPDNTYGLKLENGGYGDLLCEGESSAFPLPPGTTDFKIYYEGRPWGVEFRMNLIYKLHPTDHVKGLIGKNNNAFDLINIGEAWAEQNGNSYITGNHLIDGTTAGIIEDVKDTENESGDKGYDKILKQESTHKYTGATPAGGLTKSMSASNNKDKGRADITVSLSEDEYLNIRNMGVSIEDAIEAGLLSEAREGIFYDLLPKGVTVDMSSIRATTYSTNCIDNSRMPDCTYTVEMKDNWRGSGQTMMIVKVQAPEGYRNWAKSTTYLDTGFRLTFKMYDSWDNIDINGINLTNNAAYYGLYGDIPKGAADTGGNYANDMFKDLDGDGNKDPDAPKNCTYAQKKVSVDFPRASQAGFEKKVKGSADIEYSNTTTIPATGAYTYSLRYALKDKAKAKGVIMYDVLDAGTDPATGTASAWKGTFQGIDVSQIKSAIGNIADVKVYYGIGNMDVVKKQLNNKQKPNLSTSAWTDKEPKDLSTVKAIAVDVSKKNGVPVELEGKLALLAQIYMKAPKDEKAIADSGKKAINISYVFQEGTGISYSDPTEVALEKPKAAIQKTSTPNSGASAETGSVVKANEEVVYQLHAQNNNTADVMENVVIEDTINDYLAIDKAGIRYYFGSGEPKKITAQSEVKYEINSNNKITFTVSRLRAKETVHLIIPTTVKPAAAVTGQKFENEAHITKFNNTSWTGYDSNKTYHTIEEEKTKVVVQKTWDDWENLFNYRPKQIKVQITADGEKLPGEIYTLKADDDPDKNWKVTLDHLPKSKEVAGGGVQVIDYSAEELDTPPGYECESVKKSTVGDSTQITIKNKGNATLQNQKLTLRIQKYRNNTMIPLEGVVFELLAQDPTEVAKPQTIGDASTDEEGKAAIEFVPDKDAKDPNIAANGYTIYLREYSTVNGYVKNGTVWRVILKLSGDDKIHTVSGDTVVELGWEIDDIEEAHTDENYKAFGFSASPHFFFNSFRAELEVGNIYNPDSATLELPVEKVIEGNARPSSDKKTFIFELEDTEGEPMPESNRIQITDEGTATFGTITYREAGTYHYTVKEVIPDPKEAGYTYDETIHNITVKVEDFRGSLTATWTDDKAESGQTAVTFTNRYTGRSSGGGSGSSGDGVPEPGPTLEIPLENEVKGQRRPREKDFTFELIGGPDSPMPAPGGESVTVTGESAGKFGGIIFTKEGTYTYTIKQKKGNEPGYTYDETEHKITVTVVKREGKLDVTWSSDGGEGKKPVFTEHYLPRPVEVTVPVEKVITGDLPQDKTYRYVLKQGDKVVGTLTITGNGKKEMKLPPFTEAGTYQYQVVELDDNGVEMSGAEHSYFVDITVVDNNGILEAITIIRGSREGEPVSTAVFKEGFKGNVNTAPNTGEGSNLLLWVAMMMISGLLLKKSMFKKR